MNTNCDMKEIRDEFFVEIKTELFLIFLAEISSYMTSRIEDIKDLPKNERKDYLTNHFVKECKENNIELDVNKIQINITDDKIDFGNTYSTYLMMGFSKYLNTYNIDQNGDECIELPFGIYRGHIVNNNSDEYLKLEYNPPKLMFFEMCDPSIGLKV